MREGPQMMFAFPRPGPALKVVLATIVAAGLLGAIVVNWIPGGTSGTNAFLWLACTTERVWHHGEVWRLLTAGLLTLPSGQGSISHLFFTLVGLYFLSPDLERRWGSWRFVWFLVTSIVIGYVLAILIDLVAQGRGIFHTPAMFGASAAITSTAIAWS